MRAGKRKTLKRGRKRGIGILKAKKDDTKVSKKSKGKGKGSQKGSSKAPGSKAPRSKAKAKVSDSPETTVEHEAEKPKRKRARTPKQVADAENPPKPRGRKAKALNEERVKQQRVGEGKNWRYKVVEGQQFGCTNCRFIYNGCKNCQKETFNGRSAQQVWEEEDSVQEEHVEPMAPAAKVPGKGKGKRSKKA